APSTAFDVPEQGPRAETRRPRLKGQAGTKPRSFGARVSKVAVARLAMISAVKSVYPLNRKIESVAGSCAADRPGRDHRIGARTT
ncbi:MAG: hypothetical protein WCB10_02380, partial [Steroidobacteraceae bacterium]